MSLVGLGSVTSAVAVLREGVWTHTWVLPMTLCSVKENVPGVFGWVSFSRKPLWHLIAFR